jgi:hypothetical protein
MKLPAARHHKREPPEAVKSPLRSEKLQGILAKANNETLWYKSMTKGKKRAGGISGLI